MKILLTRSKALVNIRGFAIALILFPSTVLHTPSRVAAQEANSKDEKKEARKPEPFKIQKLTQGLGLYAIGPVSPDKKSILLIAKKPHAPPNLYLLTLGDHAIRPPLTNLKWGIANPQWSADSQMVAFAGFNETASFDEIFVLSIKTGTMRQLTKNGFSDKEPVFTPDGKQILYTSDESPL